MHAILPPSSASVWGYCTGSLTAAASYPEIETDDSRNGTAAHWVVEVSLRAWKANAPMGQEPGDYMGSVAPNGVVIGAEHIEGARVMVQDVTDTLGEEGRPALMVEHRVYMPNVDPDNWGTPDAFAMLGSTVFMWDYKHGHAKVEAVGNLQLADYLEGVRGVYNIDGHAEQYISMDARIVQPFAYSPEGPIGRWRGPFSDIRGHISFLANAAALSRSNPTLTAGKHCRWCPARVACSANRLAGYNFLEVARQPMAFDRMEGADVAAEYILLTQGAEFIKARLEAMRDELEHRVVKGDASTGFSMSAVKGRRKWTVEPEQAIAAVSVMGLDIKKIDCDTPAQARAKVPAAYREAFDQAIKSISQRKSSIKLVDVSDSMAARAFNLKK